MALEIDEILEVLRERSIDPYEEEIDHPSVGHIEEGQAIYSTSINHVFGTQDDEGHASRMVEEDLELRLFSGDVRLNVWWEEVERIISAGSHSGHIVVQSDTPWREPPEPHCAWYCPIHFFGHSWGIYIQESCILSYALNIARFVQWWKLPHALARRHATARQLLRSAFYVFYLHEQFHHKVESLGFRFLIATANDRYRPYKTNVYRRFYQTVDCVEESLTNAESYRRLNESRYTDRHERPIFEGLRRFLKASFRLQPPGYAEAM
jgi:hypothetical protein